MVTGEKGGYERSTGGAEEIGGQSESGGEGEDGGQVVLLRYYQS